MRLYLLLTFSLFTAKAFGASCCVSNTGFANLMVLPAKWQQTFSVSQSRVIGDVDGGGKSIFRNDGNRESVTAARLDLAYAWTGRYQTGIGLRYQNRDRQFHGDEAQDSGWSDVVFSHALQAPDHKRLWFFQSLNVPAAKSTYDSEERLAVDAHGTGTYQLGQGVLRIFNFKEWDLLVSPEVHYAFARTFKRQDEEVEILGFWGGGLLLGAGYVPWRSKTRYGLSINPRYETAKTVRVQGEEGQSDPSLVWDTSLNVTHTFTAEYSLGVSYLDQTLIGPARNTLLNRTLAFIFQSRF